MNLRYRRLVKTSVNMPADVGSWRRGRIAQLKKSEANCRRRCGRRHYILAAVLLLSGVLSGVSAAAGLVLRGPTVLYDAPSAQATALSILSTGYPLKEISRVDGWRKVSIYGNKSGWVREKQTRRVRAAVCITDAVAARSSPSANAAEVFYARRGVVLEVLRETNGWLEVLHTDGETGYMPLAEVWTNY